MNSQEVNVDFINQQEGQGEIATNMLQSGKLDIGRKRPYIGSDGKSYVSVYKGGDPKKPENYSRMQVNAGTLRREEWQRLDQAVLGIAEKRLSGVQDLVDRGLTFNLGNAMGTTVLEYHDIGDAMEAELSMDAVTRSKGDRPEFKSVYLPIPIISSDYEINERVLAASRNLGNPLDTTMAERAARKVSEKLENMLFTNTDYSFGGGSIKSYINFGDRNQTVIDTAWSDDAVDGEDIIDDVLDMKQASIDDNFFGPWMLYIPTAYETKMDEDYSTSKGQNTIRQRVEAISGIEGVKVIDTLPADNVLLVQMTSDVVRLVRGMGIQNIQWQTEGGFVNKFKVISIQVPQIRSDQDGQCGIVHAATT